MASWVLDAVGNLSSLALQTRPYPPPTPVDAVMAPAFSLASYVLALALAFFGRTALVAGWATPPNATTLNGTYVGVYNAEYDQDFFLGVPYAQPPLGELRFANPRSLNASFEGSRNATEYSDECVGYGVSPSIYSTPDLGLTSRWPDRPMGIHCERGLFVSERHPARKLLQLRGAPSRRCMDPRECRPARHALLRC